MRYTISDETLEKIKNSIHNSDNKLVKLAGIKVISLSERYINLEMPLGDVHVNHLGTAYAISMLMLMEIAGASLIKATYGFETYIPMIKKIDVVYLKPTTKTLMCELSISEEEAQNSIFYIEENGKGNFNISVLLKDADGYEVAKSNIVFYLLSDNR
jgi:acyl-coenzyme A thioesterase PaaI-like protein